MKIVPFILIGFTLLICEIGLSAPNWADSYEAGGKCYCDSTFDHGLKSQSYTFTVNGVRRTEKITKICDELGSGSGPRTYYNDIQCGNGPANDARDETICPGIPIAAGRYTGPKCNNKGPKWDLAAAYGGEHENDNDKNDDNNDNGNDNNDESNESDNTNNDDSNNSEEEEQQQSSGVPGWADSYSANNQCYCMPNISQGSRLQIVSFTINGTNFSKSVGQICDKIASAHGAGPAQGRTYYNDLHCGHGVFSSALDKRCPGFQGGNCNAKGSTFNLESLFASEIENKPDQEENQEITEEEDGDVEEGIEGNNNNENINYCSSSSFDHDGDGYGWERSQSCVVRLDDRGGNDEGNEEDAEENDNDDNINYCSSSSFDHDGDGYGWERNRSCIVLDDDDDQDEIVNNDNNDGKNYCSSSLSDHDGDGYGWERNRSCVVRAEDRGENTEEVDNSSNINYCSSSSFDHDGDGYGWEEDRSCVVIDD